MRLTTIPVSKIRPNPDNPRGINIPEEDEKLAYLKESISEFGIMVPIVVSQRGDEYLLIDGERRYWASRSLKLDRMPAFIIDPDGDYTEEDILYRMFQIHHNREQWGPVQQCHALEALYRNISQRADIRRIKEENTRIDAITEELVKATGIETRTARNRIYFLRQPKAIRHRLYHNPGEEGYWYLCEIEEKIVIPAMTNYPEYFESVPAEEVRTDLFKKLEEHTVERSTDVRRVAPFFRAPLSKDSDRKKVLAALRTLRKPSTTYLDAQDELSKALPQLLKRDPVSPRKLHSLIRALQAAMDDFDAASFSSAKTRAKASRRELRVALSDLITSIDHFLDQLTDGADKA